MDPIILAVAPNGARKTKKDHSHLPLSAEEIAADAKRCADAGATFIHLHVRDEKAAHTLDVTTYKHTIQAIRAAVGERLIIQVTSEAVGVYSPQQQMQMVRQLKPESVSLAIRELIPTQADEAVAGEFFAWLQQENILPQYVLYDEKEVAYFSALRKRGIIPGKKALVLFVLGRRNAYNAGGAATPPTPEDLEPYLECFADGLVNLADTIWFTAAFGKHSLACAKRTMECGGHPRIGFENNFLLADGTIADDNAALVKECAESLPNGRKLATVSDTRELLKSD